jgi:proteic killer suppression protein
LNNYGGLNFEKLKGDLKGYYSIRLNQQYRLLFRVENEEQENIKIEIVEVTDISKHYE